MRYYLRVESPQEYEFDIGDDAIDILIHALNVSLGKGADMASKDEQEVMLERLKEIKEATELEEKANQEKWRHENRND